MNLPRLSELPNWADAKRVCIDTETRDEQLKKLGPGVRRDGYITGMSFCIDDENGPAFYLPMRHEGGGNYDDPERVIEYLKDMAKHFRGELLTVNGQYDLDYLAEIGVIYRNVMHRDIQISGPLLDQPTMARMQDEETGQWFWGNEIHLMGLDAQAKRLGLPGKDEAQLNAWAEAKGLDPKKDMWKAPAGIVAPYAIQDVRLPMSISRMHEVEIDKQDLRRVYDMECKLMPVLVKMRRRGVAVDLKKVEQIEAMAWAKETLACNEISKLSGFGITPEDTNKSAALAKCLERTGVKVPRTETKFNKKTGKESGGGPSVTSPWLRSLGTPLAKAILVAKRWNKVRTTFCQSINEHQVKGRIHCTFNQLRQERETGETKGAAFGRLSSTGPNLQQQPARDPEIGPLWRSIYLPDDGGQWACLDFSSQEPRLITHYAELTGCEGGDAAAEACRTDPNWDNHSMMASMLYDEFDVQHFLDYERAEKGSPEEKLFKIAKGLRGDAKTIFLGLCYGMGGGKLCRSLGLPTMWVVRDPNASGWVTYDVKSPQGKSLRLAGARPFEMAGTKGQALLDRFKQRVPFVQQLQAMCKTKAQNVGFIKTLLGRRCRFPIHPETGRIEWAHKGLNRLIQGGAADQTKLAMVLADEAGIRLQLQVHDELDLTIWNPKEAQQLNEIMVNAIPLNVPTRCDIETGPTWGQISLEEMAV